MKKQLVFALVCIALLAVVTLAEKQKEAGWCGDVPRCGGHACCTIEEYVQYLKTEKQKETDWCGTVPRCGGHACCTIEEYAQYLKTVVKPMQHMKLHN